MGKKKSKYKGYPMIKKIPDQFWFPFWVDKWIFGSMRIEFNPVERAIWVDLLALAAKDDGFIRANEETPYPPEQLAGLLVYDITDFKTAIENFVEKNKIKRDKNGILYITNWNKYKLANSYKRILKHRKVLLGETESVTSETESVTSETESVTSETESVTSETENVTQIKSNQIKSNHNNKKTTSSAPNDNNRSKQSQKINFNFISKKWENITDEDLTFLSDSYPACDIKIELKKMAAWLVANPKKRKKDYRRFINNWLSRQQDSGGTKGIKKSGLDSWLEKSKAKDELV
ncbi:MAG TPA: hypothetical protein ENN23_02885 [Deltaproteobacteria bacterium]|nr:hypothetical protein [Deltaproteobacteria bacterium]